jgi:hypothetical protein
MIGAIPIIAENRIREAMERGEFDRLKGSGKPFTDLDGVHRPDWWITKKIGDEHLPADEVEYFKERLQAAR